MSWTCPDMKAYGGMHSVLSDLGRRRCLICSIVLPKVAFAWSFAKSDSNSSRAIFSALCTITYPGFEPWFLLKRNDPMNFAQNEAMFDIKL